MTLRIEYDMTLRVEKPSAEEITLLERMASIGRKSIACGRSYIICSLRGILATIQRIFSYIYGDNPTSRDCSVRRRRKVRDRFLMRKGFLRSELALRAQATTKQNIAGSKVERACVVTHITHVIVISDPSIARPEEEKVKN